MEETLFDIYGTPVAYIDHTSPEKAVYLWNGTPVCYLAENLLYGYNGSHLGWFEDGVIYDLSGYRIGYNRGALHVIPHFEPFKSFKQFKPFRSFREFAHYRPLFSIRESEEPLSQFLSRGRK